MRITIFRRLMAEEFGESRAEMIASQHVLADLDGRTVDQALADGLPTKRIWLAVCESFEVPDSRR